MTEIFLVIAPHPDGKIPGMAGTTAPHPRSPRAVTSIAQACGSVAGTACAEPFSLVRLVDRQGART